MNVYFKSLLLNWSGLYLPVSISIFKKSFKAPLRRCGIDSDTTLISRCEVLRALSIKIGRIPNVLPADYVPPPPKKIGEYCEVPP